MSKGEIEEAADLLVEGLEKQGFDFWAGGEGEYRGHSIAVFLLDVVHFMQYNTRSTIRGNACVVVIGLSWK